MEDVLIVETKLDKLISLECDCKFEKIEIEEFNLMKTLTPKMDRMLSIRIYNHRSNHTGKILKKQKLLADVVLNYDKVEKLIKMFKNVK